jgi:hypothetical protein
VLDFSPAKFGKTFTEQGIETKFINAVQTASYEMGGSAVARIVFTLKQEIGFEVQVEKNKLSVHIHGKEPFVPNVDAMLANNKTNLLSETREEIPEIKTEQERIEETAERLVTLERKRAEEKRKAEEGEVKKRLEEEKKAKAEGVTLMLKPQFLLPVTPSVRSKLSFLTICSGSRGACGPSTSAAPLSRDSLRSGRPVLAEPQLSSVSDLHPKAEEAARLVVLERKRAEEKRKAEKEEAKKRQISGRLELVGFKQDGQYSRVLVRTNQPIRYSIGKANSKTLILRLENTKIGNRSVLRFLDTQYFDSPVNRVWPRIAGNAIEVEIELKLPATYGIRQQDEVIIVEFK